MARHMQRIQQGFVLIELMVVISIIGTLAAIALPPYQDYVIRAKISEGIVLAAPVQKAVSDYYDRWGKLPTNNAAATLAAPKAYSARHVESIEVTAGVVTVVFKNIQPISSKESPSPTLTLRPAINTLNPTGAIVWSCSQSPVPSNFKLIGTIPAHELNYRYLPGPCR